MNPGPGGCSSKQQRGGRHWWGLSGGQWTLGFGLPSSWLVEMLGWFGLSLGGYGLSSASSMQDSDGDKSDDLVVDVSRGEGISPVAGRSLCGELEIVPAPWWELLCSGYCTFTGSSAGFDAFGLGHQAGQEEEDRAWLLGGWGVINHAGFQKVVSRERERDPEDPSGGRLLVL